MDELTQQKGNSGIMSHLVVCGLNYHSSPLAIRERFTIPQSCVSHALEALSRLPHIKEAAILSTCNRTEVYAVVSNVQAGWQEIESFFTAAQTISDHGSLKPNFRLLREDVALHLFRVAAGLDSMILGESQIMSQVKGAHQAALEAKTAGPVLDHLFKQALSCGKRVRTETSMGKRAVSVSSAALELARHTIGELKDKRVVVIGAGKMAQICVKLLLSESGTGTVFLLNRSKERIKQFLKNNLSNMHRLETEFDFEDRYKLAATADLVILSTSAHSFLLEREKLAVARSKDNATLAESAKGTGELAKDKSELEHTASTAPEYTMFAHSTAHSTEEAGETPALPDYAEATPARLGYIPEHCLRALKEQEAKALALAAAGCPVSQRATSEPSVSQQNTHQQKDLCIIDISVPRNVDPDAASLPGVKLFHSDDLADLVSRNLAEREALVSEAEEIVFETLDDFHAWQRSLLVVPTIAGLREKIEAIRQEQMAKTRGGQPSSSDELEPNRIEEISRAIVNQILHHPTVQLKATRDYEILRQQAEALRTLFSLDPLGAVAPSTFNAGKRIRLVEQKPHHLET